MIGVGPKTQKTLGAESLMEDMPCWLTTPGHGLTPSSVKMQRNLKPWKMLLNIH